MRERPASFSAATSEDAQLSVPPQLVARWAALAAERAALGFLPQQVRSA